MQWYIDQDILPCINTLVMRGTEVLDYKCFGYMDIANKTPLREDAIYRMYSNTKLVTSVALMQLYEQGKFQLQDSLADFIPVFADLQVLIPGATAIDQTEPLQSPITIAQVLSHTAGFSYGFIEPESVIDGAYLGNGLNIFSGFSGDLADLMDKMSQFPLAYQPGTGWRYSLATDVAARLVEVLSGQRFDDYLQSRIFGPLGMVDTGFYVAPEKLERLVTMAAPNNIFDPMAGGLTRMDTPQSVTSTPNFLSGGGGLYSTVADYLSFVRMMISGGEWGGVRILQTETLQLMRESQLAEGVTVQFPAWAMPGTEFGLGFAVKTAIAEDDPTAALGEYHWGGMAGTHSWMSPWGTSGMCMTQLMPGFWHPFSHDFKRYAYQLTQ